MFVSKYSEEEKKEWIEEFKHSGKSASEFSKKIGVPPTTFRDWIRKEMNKCYNNSFGEIKVLDNFETSNITNYESQIKYCGSKITIILEKGFDKEFLEKVVEVLVNDK